MARIRTIKPDTTLDFELARLGYAARYFFINLWCHCDREGRLNDDPEKLHVLIIPWEKKLKADQLLNELHPKFVIRYESGGKRFLQVRTFSIHQRPHIREPESSIPPPIFTEYRTKDPRETHEPVLGSAQHLPGPLDKGKGMDTGYLIYSTELAQPPTSEPKLEEPFITFPCNGSGPKDWPLYKPKIKEWAEAYPAVDLEQELYSARQWCLDNPKKRKTPAGMLRFLSSWLSRAQNRGQRNA